MAAPIYGVLHLVRAVVFVNIGTTNIFIEEMLAYFSLCIDSNILFICK